MVKNLFKHSLRALNRQKGYLLINLAGLSTGMACSLIIALFIMHELSYDQFNVKKDRIFRINVYGTIGERELNFGITLAPLGPAMLKEIPEIEDFNRMYVYSETKVRYLEKSFMESRLIESDSSFFHVFSVPLIRGDIKKVLNKSHTLVISKSTARKIFGREDPIDKLLLIGNDSIPFRITGIMADIPETSHFDANMIASFMSYGSSFDNNWTESNFVTYILLKPDTDPGRVNAKMPGMIRKYMGPSMQQFGITVDEFMTRNNYKWYLQPLSDIHFSQVIIQTTKPSSNQKYIYIFGSIAILIIVIASINFMNLSTAQAARRAKEVGIKKVSGSSREMLIRQFLTESVFLSFSALALAIILVENTLPLINNLLRVKLELDMFTPWYTLPVLLLFSVIVGIFAGSYPAFFLSSFNPYIVLKGKLRGGMKTSRLRSILVILQFSISIVLVAGTIIMARQIRFMMNSDLGFNNEQLLVISNADALGNRINPFKDAVRKIPEVLKVGFSTAVPGHSESGTTYAIEGRPGEVFEFKINFIDEDFLDTYGIPVTSGREFKASFGSDRDACMVNESAVRQLSLNNPLNNRLVDRYNKLPVIGITKDFHFESLRNEISPYVFRYNNENNTFHYISIRLSGKASAITVQGIENTWNAFISNDPFRYFFMDQEFSQKYQEERQNAKLSFLFSILAIIIASLGLFGLTSFTIEQRTKEIGIRKTMGASVVSIFYLISKEFILLVSVAALISCPLIYYAAHNWLQNYYYRIDLHLFDFLSGFIIAAAIALMTISYRTLKSARSNPVDALRYE
jgi:putative ABC transport system permease protein